MRLLVATTLAAAFALQAAAQAAPPARPTFSAFTVKLVMKDGRMLTSGMPCPDQNMENPQRIIRCGHLEKMIQEAYAPALVETKLSSVPCWVTGDSLEIQATTDTPTDHATKMQMMQALLEDRFQLKLQADKHDKPVLALVVAPGGPKFQQPPSSGAEPQASTDVTVCNFRTMADFVAHLNLYTSFGTSWPASNGIDKPVVDETELTGEYDLHFYLNIPRNAMPALAHRLKAEPYYPDVIKQQLGLELVPKTEAFTVYTIANAVEPNEDGN